MYFDESRPFGTTAVGTVTFWLGYNVGAPGWGAIGAVAVMFLYWVIFREVGTNSQSQRVDDLPSAQATTLAPSPAELRIEAVNGGTRITEAGRVPATEAGRRQALAH